jgi:hypothetical protein
MSDGEISGPVDTLAGEERAPSRSAARRHAGQPHLRWWAEVLYIAAFYGLYTLVRNTFGSNGSAKDGQISQLAVEHAFGHAQDIIQVERALGFFVEPHLQHWYLSLPFHGFIRFWNIYYGSFHFVVTIGALLLLFFRAPERYPKWRNALGATTALALIGFAAYALMPPRLLDSTALYGACHIGSYDITHLARCTPGHGYGLIDTLERFGGLWSFGSGTMANISNQYAAMPSLHIGWSTWCALVLFPMTRRWWLRALIVLYPLATLFCILVTANHYWIDAVGGLATLGVGYAIGANLDRLTRRLRARWRSRHDDGRAVSDQPGLSSR